MIVKPIIKQCKNHSCTKDTTENPSARFECQELDPSNEILTTKCGQIIKIIKNINPKKATSPEKNSIKIFKSCSKYC